MGRDIFSESCSVKAVGFQTVFLRCIFPNRIIVISRVPPLLVTQKLLLDINKPSNMLAENQG